MGGPRNTSRRTLLLRFGQAPTSTRCGSRAAGPYAPCFGVHRDAGAHKGRRPPRRRPLWAPARRDHVQPHGCPRPGTRTPTGDVVSPPPSRRATPQPPSTPRPPNRTEPGLRAVRPQTRRGQAGVRPRPRRPGRLPQDGPRLTARSALRNGDAQRGPARGRRALRRAHRRPPAWRARRHGPAPAEALGSALAVASGGWPEPCAAVPAGLSVAACDRGASACGGLASACDGGLTPPATAPHVSREAGRRRRPIGRPACRQTFR